MRSAWKLVSLLFLVGCSGGGDGTTTRLDAAAGDAQAVQDDAGATVDAGRESDAGSSADAGARVDSGEEPDAGEQNDAGQALDAGDSSDAGADPDAGPDPDAGSGDAGPGGVAACLQILATARLDRDFDGVTHPSAGPGELVAASRNGLRVAYAEAAPEFDVWPENAVVSTPTNIILRDVRTGEQFDIGPVGGMGMFDGTGDTYFMSGRFLRRFDWATRAASNVRTANAGMRVTGVSADGARVLVESTATDLVAGGTGLLDVYLLDVVMNTVTRVSEAPNGSPADGASTGSALSDDGAFVVYRSSADNIVANDTNGVDDVFRYEVATQTNVRVSVDAAGAEANGASSNDTFVTQDGSTVFFRSAATNLVPNDADGQPNYFAKTIATGAVERFDAAYELVSVDGPGVQMLVNDDFLQARVVDRTSGTAVAFGGNGVLVTNGGFTRDGSLLVYDISLFQVGVLAEPSPFANAAPTTDCGAPLPAGPAGWRFKPAPQHELVAYDVSLAAAGSIGYLWFGDDGPGLNQVALGYDAAVPQVVPVNVPGFQQLGADHSSVWTGDRLLLFGGRIPSSGIVQNEAFAYDPVFATFQPLATVARPAARDRHRVVWTGSEMIIWGGLGGTGPLGDGARYDPALDQWTPVSLVSAPAARADHVQVWTGSEMIVWGGSAGATGARYNPFTDTWTAMATAGGPATNDGVWANGRLVTWAGTTGATYDPAMNAWTAMSTVNAPAGGQPIHIVTPNHVVVFTDTNIGAYDVQADTWTSMVDYAPYGSPYYAVANQTIRAVWLGTDLWIVGALSTARLGPVTP